MTDDSSRVLAVDLAARFSAAAVVESPEPEVFKVLVEIDSTGSLDLVSRQLRPLEVLQSTYRTERAFVARLMDLYYEHSPIVMAVEDLPHGVRFDSTAKRVARLQGRIIDRMDRDAQLDRLRFPQPSLWMRTIPGVWRQGTKGQLEAAALLGYSPPEFGPGLSGRGTGDARARARKIQTDYVSTFLIGVWACRLLRQRGDLDVANCQAYALGGSGGSRSNQRSDG